VIIRTSPEDDDNDWPIIKAHASVIVVPSH
jgi:hypothetical protein